MSSATSQQPSTSQPNSTELPAGTLSPSDLQTAPIPQRTAIQTQHHQLLNGQYYTPSALCDWMLSLAFLLRPPPSPGTIYRLLEPGCGTGRFLQRAYHALTQQHGFSPAQGAACLYGVELDPESLQRAQDEFAQWASPQPPNWLGANFVGEAIEAWGEFDLIIGNPPYVRQEHIHSQSPAGSKTDMLQYLTRQYADYLTAFPSQRPLFQKTGDLYIWFYLQATARLKPGGQLLFVTSNSWLNTQYGKPFRQFLQHYFHIHALVESTCERWFPNAAINAVILSLTKKAHLPWEQPADEQIESLSPPPIACIRLLKPLADWMPSPDAPNYWTQLQQQTQAILAAPSTEALQQSLPAALFQQPLGVDNRENNWALLLRAPTELRQLLSHSSSQTPYWLPLQQIGKVRYPLKTGINQFFYLSKAKARQWQIEPEFLFPVIRSTRQIQRYHLTADDCPDVLFSCTQSETALAQREKTAALAYIQWGAQQTAPPRQKRQYPVPWPQVASVQSTNRAWYSITPIQPAHLLCPRFIHERFFFAYCQDPIMEDQTFYGLTVAAPHQHAPRFVAALLNSTLSYLFTEFWGRTNLGEGILQFACQDLATLPILNPALYPPAQQEHLITLFETMSQRNILPIQQELTQPDRLALDLAVLAPLRPWLEECSGQPAEQHAGAAISDTAAFPQALLAFRERLADYLLQRVQERRRIARSCLPASKAASLNIL